MMKNEINYSEYTVCVGNDESNYGSDVTRAEATTIADTLQQMIEAEFPGINVRRTEESGEPTPTRGPDDVIIEEIDRWVQDNWTAAL